MKRRLFLLIVICCFSMIFIQCGGGNEKTDTGQPEMKENQASDTANMGGTLVIETLTKEELAEVYDQIVIAEAPAFTVYDLNKNEIKSESFKGYVLLLNFWSMDSPVSKRQFKTLSEIQNTYRDRKFTVLGICVDRRSIKDIQEAADINRLAYPAVYPSTTAIYQDYEVADPGKSVIIDGNGNIIGDFYDDPGVERLSRVIELFLED